MLPDAHLVGTGIRDVDFGEFEHFGSAVSADQDGLRLHEISLLASGTAAGAIDGRDNT